MKLRIIFAAGFALAALAGCASFSQDGGFGEVDAAVKARAGQSSVWVRSNADAKAIAERVKELLAAPLGPEQAVAIALLNNPALQAAYAEIGVSEAERVQAGRLVNPGFSFARLAQGDELEIDRKLVFNLLDLFTLPRRVEIAAQRFEQVKLGAATLTACAAAPRANRCRRAGSLSSSCRSSTRATRGSRAPRTCTCRRSAARRRSRSTRVPRCARRTARIAPPTISPSGTATRSFP
jgi:hypothetical protein